MVTGIRPTRTNELDGLRSAVATGRERAAVGIVRGRPGAGKSWIIDRLLEVEDAALHETGTVVLRMSGHPAESDLPFAGLHQLLLPLETEIEQLPAPQRLALEQALARSSTGDGHRFATSVGLHALLTTLAERQPVLIIAEDAHWLDTSTMTSLVFTVRRLGADRITVLFTTRDPELPAGLGAIEVELHPLDALEAREVLLHHHPDLSSSVAAEIIRVAAGLPVVLTEGPADLTHAQRVGADPLPAVLPIGSTLSWLYRQRLSAIGPDARLALVVMSLERLDQSQLDAALAVLDLDRSALDAAEEHGLIERDQGERALAHATVSAAILTDVDQQTLAAGRAAVAAALTDLPHRQVWFLDAAAGGHDEALALRWDAAGLDAQRRGAWAEAATAHERAARCSASSHTARSRLTAAANASARAGAPVALLRLLDELAADTDDPDARLFLEAQRITARAWSHPQRIEIDDVESVIRSQPGAHPRSRALLRSTFAIASLVWGDHNTALAAIDAATRDLDGSETVLADRLVRDLIEVTSGREGAGSTLRGEWLDEVSDVQLLDPTVPMFLASYVLVMIDDLDGALRVATRLRDVAGRFADLSQLGLATALVAAVEQRRGDMLAARAHYTAAVQLCLDTDFTAPVPHLQLRYAELLASLGQESACRTVVAESLAGGNESLVMRHGAAWALGLLELALGDCGKAVMHLDEAETLIQEMELAEPGYTSQAGDLVEALWRLRRIDEAARVLDRFSAGAVRHRRDSSLAIAARCRGLLAEPDEIDRHFEAAHRHHTLATDRIQQARTDLLWGMQLRRARRKRDARPRLRSALAAFEEMGATPWAAQAASELTACGERRRTAWAAVDELTPRELEVAVIVADGATNPEAAAALCISIRTVEDHLTRIYRKLAIPGRQSLAAALDRPTARSAHDPPRPAST